MSDIKIVKLIDGCEILADILVTEDKVGITLKNPTQIACGPNPKTGQVDVHMAPLLPLAAKREIIVNVDQILYFYDPVDDIVNKYNSMFGSGIVVPNKNIIA